MRWQDAQCARSMPYQRCSQPAQVTGSQVGSSFATTDRLRVPTDETGALACDARDVDGAQGEAPRRSQWLPATSRKTTTRP